MGLLDTTSRGVKTDVDTNQQADYTVEEMNMDFDTRPAGRLCSEKGVQELDHCNIAWYRWVHDKQ